MDSYVTSQKELEALIEKTKGIIESASEYIQLLRKVAAEEDNLDKQNEVNAEADELEKHLDYLATKVKTSDIQNTSNKIISLWDDLMMTKSSIQDGNLLIPSKTITREKAENEFVKAGIEVHSKVDKLN